MDSNLLYNSDLLSDLIKEGRTVFITMPRESLEKADKEEIILKVVEKSSADHLTYAGSALPVEDIQKLYEHVRESKYSHIVAVGGGTVMDIAKIIAVALSNRLENVEEILLKPSDYPNTIKLIFIPTTCGTGSEATHFAVVYKNRKKYSIAHDSIKAEYVILDYRFLVELPENIRNATVLDALSQAIESIWAKNGTDGSRIYAKEAIGLILKGLECKNKVEKLKYFQKGSYLAGKAINISKTTASHAISYPLTARFGVPHGIAVFLTLPDIAELNYCKKTERSFKVLFDLFGVKDISELKKTLQNIMTSFKFSRNLSDYGISKSDLASIAAQSIVPGRSDNNPVEVTEEKVLEILRKNNFQIKKSDI